jgi:translocator protein
MNTYISYATLLKPSWAPPSWLFGPVWSFLYLLIVISFGSVFVMAFQKTIPWSVALPFVLNIVFNILFTPLQFGLRSLPLASIDIILVLATLIWAIVAIAPYARWIAWMQVPYLVWVGFATVLQLTITFMNW